MRKNVRCDKVPQPVGVKQRHWQGCRGVRVSSAQVPAEKSCKSCLFVEVTKTGKPDLLSIPHVSSGLPSFLRTHPEACTPRSTYLSDSRGKLAWSAPTHTSSSRWFYMDPPYRTTRFLVACGLTRGSNSCNVGFAGLLDYADVRRVPAKLQIDLAGHST